MTSIVLLLTQLTHPQKEPLINTLRLGLNLESEPTNWPLLTTWDCRTIEVEAQSWLQFNIDYSQLYNHLFSLSTAIKHFP